MKRAGGGKPAAPANKSKPYARPEPIQPGEILTDIANKSWKLGKSCGAGGFGDIYLASNEITKTVSDKNAEYVIKIEPHTNGPLYVEINFYLRAAKEEMVQEWKTAKGISALGMPTYIASGSHTYKSEKYRFMVLQRFGQDLDKVLELKSKKTGSKRFSTRTIQAISLQVLDIIEYIHSRGFVHGDIKASNLLLDLKCADQLYLLDYGLAGRYLNTANEHFAYAPDLRKAHNGTLEYTSRDAHIGALSRRGDLEIIGYNLLDWYFGTLPWSRSDAPTIVHSKKSLFMETANVKKYYPDSAGLPGVEMIEKFLKYVKDLEFTQDPDYDYCRSLFRRKETSARSAAARKAAKPCLYLDDSDDAEVDEQTGGGKKTGAKNKKRSLSKRKTDKKTEDKSVDEGVKLPTDLSIPPVKKLKLPSSTASSKSTGGTDGSSASSSKTKKRSTRTTEQVQPNFNWVEVLSSNPENLLRSNAAAALTPATAADHKKKSPDPLHGTSLTPAMRDILSKKKENLGTTTRGKSNTLAAATVTSAAGADAMDTLVGYSGVNTTPMTPQMKAIILKRKTKKK